MNSDATEPIYRWRVVANIPEADASMRAELIKRAGCGPDSESGPAVWGLGPHGAPTNLQWLFATKRQGDAAEKLAEVRAATVISESAGNRTLTESEGRTTFADLLAGTQACVNCGAPVNPRDSQIAGTSFMFGTGTQFRYDAATAACGTTSRSSRRSSEAAAAARVSPPMRDYGAKSWPMPASSKIGQEPL